MALPSYVVWFRGKPACLCLAEWLPYFEAELQRRGTLRGPLPIYQLIGEADASAETHSKGGAFDITDLAGDIDLEVARQMGADATWSRDAGFSTRHVHGVLRGCRHNTPARYQIDAVDAGFNGLGAAGRGGADDGPRPLSGRTWKQGIQWAIEQGDDMPFTEQEIRTIVREETAKIATAAVETLLSTELGNGQTVQQNLRRAGDTKELAKDIIAELAAEQKRLGQ